MSVKAHPPSRQLPAATSSVRKAASRRRKSPSCKPAHTSNLSRSAPPSSGWIPPSSPPSPNSPPKGKGPAGPLLLVLLISAFIIVALFGLIRHAVAKRAVAGQALGPRVLVRGGLHHIG